MAGRRLDLRVLTAVPEERVQTPGGHGFADFTHLGAESFHRMEGHGANLYFFSRTQGDPFFGIDRTICVDGW